MLSSPNEGEQRGGRGGKKRDVRADNGRGSVSAGLNIRVAHILRAKQDKHDCVALRHKRLEGVLAHRRLRGGGEDLEGRLSQCQAALSALAI